MDLMRSLLISLFAASALWACNVTETGNPSAALTGTASLPEFHAFGPDAIDGTTVFHHAYFSFGAMELVGSDCVPTGAPTVPSPATIDLAFDTEVLELPVDAGEYCSLRVERRLAGLPLPSDAPAALEGAHVLIIGTRPDGTPFEVRSRRTNLLDLGSWIVPFFDVAAGERFLLLTDISAVIEDVDLFAGVVGSDGVLRIDDTDNADLLAAIETNLEIATALYRDSDGDRRASGAEIDFPVAKRP